MEGRCRSTTSTACTGLVLMGLSSSRGSGMLRPVSTSWSMCQLTRDTNLMETLNGRSFPPSPGSVTSRSTWGGGQKESRRTRQDKRRLAHRRLCLLRVDLCVWRRNVYVCFLCHVSVMFSSSPLWVPQAVGWLCTGSSFHRRLACDPQRLSP